MIPCVQRRAGMAGRPGAPVPEIPSSLRCFAVLVAIKVCLAALRFHGSYRLLERVTARYPAAESGASEAVEATAARVAYVAAFVPGRALCLEQSLALLFLLRRMGIQARLRLGAQAFPFVAHAWVEHGGVPVNETSETLAAFVPFPMISEQAP